MRDLVYYAIGDVHGEDDKLARLHDMIFANAERHGAPVRIVHLGDLIDRGPNSRGVVSRVIEIERKGSGLAIMGNHERMLIDAYDSSSLNDFAVWSNNGGEAALDSYETAHGAYMDWRQSIDLAHLHWLRNLPLEHFDAERRILFVHAGIDPWRFPNCPDNLKLWTRSSKFFDTGAWPDRPELEGLLVVHGHTPTTEFHAHVSPRRINVDTGACYGGPLSCVMLAPGEPPRILETP